MVVIVNLNQEMMKGQPYLLAIACAKFVHFSKGSFSRQMIEDLVQVEGCFLVKQHCHFLLWRFAILYNGDKLGFYEISFVHALLALNNLSVDIPVCYCLVFWVFAVYRPVRILLPVSTRNGFKWRRWATHITRAVFKFAYISNFSPRPRFKHASNGSAGKVYLIRQFSTQRVKFFVALGRNCKL